ncbi:MAG: T9SS type A sorting domain-containing protein [Bacteroidia bacterium]|nr:T9SS type A sorting domain-containing protein [Bacteroidia bacterium]
MPASVRRDSLALTVLNDGERYVLHWLVPPALSCMSFIIERRLSETYSFTSDTRWIEIGMEPGMCNLFEAVPYSFPDRSTTTGMKGIMQYRLSVRTEGGGELVSYSEVITLSVPDQLEIRDMYPQPASMQVQMSFLTSDADPVTVRIFDMTGTELRRTAFSVPRPGVQHHILDVSSLPAGIYVCASESRQSIAVRTFRVVR